MMNTCCDVNPAACSYRSFRSIWNRLACLWRNNLSRWA
jgi:hypothetical protein